jgi:hypothetical protein
VGARDWLAWHQRQCAGLGATQRLPCVFFLDYRPIDCGGAFFSVFGGFGNCIYVLRQYKQARQEFWARRREAF